MKNTLEIIKIIFLVTLLGYDEKKFELPTK